MVCVYSTVRAGSGRGHTWRRANQPCIQATSTNPILRAKGQRNRQFLSLRAAAEPARQPQGVYDAVVVGAGAAGLVAAKHMQSQGALQCPNSGKPDRCRCPDYNRSEASAGLKVAVLEAGDGVGGRVRTDEVKGYKLDRGFQVFLTGYPAARDEFDFDSLQLRPFYAGALVRFQNDWQRVADPFRHLVDSMGTLTNPIGSIADKLRVGIFRLKVLLKTQEDIDTASQTTTLQYLREEGFSESIIQRFFRPFLSGTFFDPKLGVTSRTFELIMRAFAVGPNCIPANGMQAIADQLAEPLMTSGSIFLNTAVASVKPSKQGSPAAVVLGNGQTIEASKGVVIATDGPAASKLLKDPSISADIQGLPGVGTCCLYFTSDAPPPVKEPVLFLDGDGDKLVNNCCFPSSVAPSYAPPGKTLVSASIVGTRDDMTEEALVEAVRKDLADWFGAGEVSNFKFLKMYRIPFSLPSSGAPGNLKQSHELGGNVFICGDHRMSCSLHDAIVSGRKAADAVTAATPASAAVPA